MLNALRSFVGGWTAKILLILLVGSFALWGVSGSILGGADTNTVAQIGETKVPVRDYLGTYNRNINNLQRRAGRRLTQQEAKIFGVESQTLSTVVSYATLDEFARIHNISVSDQMLAKMINRNPTFQDSTGKFNRDVFQRAVYEAQMRESDYIELQKQSAIRGQISESFATGNQLSDTYKNAMNLFVGEERKFTYLTINADMAGEQKPATDEQLKTYFEANKENYEAPEYRGFVLLSIEPKDIAREEDITDEAVTADYNERIQTYSEPEKRRVHQIVFKSQEDADKAVKSLADGAVFETVLSENKIKPSDADLGLVVKKQLPKALQEEAFKLELNAPSGIVKGPFGPTMIQISEITPAKVTPLDDVKDEIRKDLALRAAADSIVTMQESVEDMRAGGATIAEVAEKLGMKSRMVEKLDRTARTPDGTVVSDLPESNKLIGQLFQTEVGAQAAPLDLGSAGYLWFDVTKITPARDRTLEEASDSVKKDWEASQRAAAVQKLAEELEERLKKDATIAELASEYKAEEKTTKLLKRSGSEETFPTSATRAGFSGGQDHLAVVAGAKADERILLKVAEIKRPEAEIVALPEQQLELVNSGVADDLLNQMINNLQGVYEVTHNPTVISQALTQNR